MVAATVWRRRRRRRRVLAAKAAALCRMVVFRGSLGFWVSGFAGVGFPGLDFVGVTCLSRKVGLTASLVRITPHAQPNTTCWLRY